jgi:hypothetical protein
MHTNATAATAAAAITCKYVIIGMVMAATFAETGDGEILVVRYDGQSAVFQVTCAECKSSALAVNTSGAAHAAPPATPGTQLTLT